jgi:hypothetical protein
LGLSDFYSEQNIDKRIDVKFNPEIIYRDIFFTIVYGYYAHGDKKKESQALLWIYGDLRPLIQLAFQNTLKRIVDVVRKIMSLNANILNTLA